MANTVASKETTTENLKLTGLHSSRSLQPKQKHVKRTPWNKTMTRCEIPSLLNSLFLREDLCKILLLFLNTYSRNPDDITVSSKYLMYRDADFQSPWEGYNPDRITYY